MCVSSSKSWKSFTLNCRAQENWRSAISPASLWFTKFATTPMAEPFPRSSHATDRSPSVCARGELAPPAMIRALQGTWLPSLQNRLPLLRALASAANRTLTPRRRALFSKSSCNSPIPMWQKSLSLPKEAPGGSKVFAPHFCRSCLHHSQRCTRLIRLKAWLAGRFSTTWTFMPSSASSKAALRPQGPAPQTTTLKPALLPAPM
mmetsp:Transcript_90426/g.161102  ORF Transcript_90426/g.161102 Transcript_90426/m.161102 type:complete len:204 (+) Transcript_90426:849-1460(+)